MRIVVQRVSSASVKTEGKVVGRIKKGLFVLIGVEEGDKEEDAYFLANKLFKLRIMADNEGKMNLSIKEAGGKFLPCLNLPYVLIQKPAIDHHLLKRQNPSLLFLYTIFL